MRLYAAHAATWIALRSRATAIDQKLYQSQFALPGPVLFALPLNFCAISRERLQIAVARLSEAIQDSADCDLARLVLMQRIATAVLPMPPRRTVGRGGCVSLRCLSVVRHSAQRVVEEVTRCKHCLSPCDESAVGPAGDAVSSAAFTPGAPEAACARAAACFALPPRTGGCLPCENPPQSLLSRWRTTQRSSVCDSLVCVREFN